MSRDLRYHRSMKLNDFAWTIIYLAFFAMLAFMVIMFFYSLWVVITA